MSFHPIKAVGQFFSDVGELGSTLIEDPKLFGEAAEYAFTGHVSSVEKAIVNTPHARQLVSDIQNIGSKGIANCKDEIHAALQDLASVKGFEYIGQLSPDAFDGALDSLGSYCTEISSQLNSAINSMEQYQNASVGANILSSMGLLSTKVAEGIGRIGETIIDTGGILIGTAVNAFDKDAGAAVKDFVGYDMIGNCSLLNNAYDAYEELGSISRDCFSSQAAVIIGETAGFGEASKGLQAIGKGIKGTTAAAKIGQAVTQSSVLNPTTVATITTFGGSGAEHAAQGDGYLELWKEAGKDALEAGATTAIIATGIQHAAKYDARHGKMVEKAQKQVDKANEAYDKRVLELEAEYGEDARLEDINDKKLQKIKNNQTAAQENLDIAKTQQEQAQKVWDKTKETFKKGFEDAKQIPKDAKEVWDNRAGKDVKVDEFDIADKKAEVAERKEWLAEDKKELSIKQSELNVEEHKAENINKRIDSGKLSKKKLAFQQESLEKVNENIDRIKGEMEPMEKYVKANEASIKNAENMISDMEAKLEVKNSYETAKLNINNKIEGLKSNISEIQSMNRQDPLGGMRKGYTEEQKTIDPIKIKDTTIFKGKTINYLQSTQPQRAVDLIAGGLGNIDRDKVMDASMKPNVDVGQVQIGSDKVLRSDLQVGISKSTGANKYQNPSNNNSGISSTGGSNYAPYTKTTPSQSGIGTGTGRTGPGTGTGGGTSTTPFNPSQGQGTSGTSTGYNPSLTTEPRVTTEPSTQDPFKQPQTEDPVEPIPTQDPIQPTPTEDPVTPTQDPVQPTPTQDPVTPTQDPVQPTPTQNPGYNPGGDVYNPANDVYTGSTHTGGGYTETDGYTPSTGATDTTPTPTPTTKKPTTSIDDIVKGNKYTKIPTSPTPITPNKQSSGLGNVIPIAAGLSAAAAAGIGAKAYLDRKRNNDNGEYDDEDDEFGAEEWNGDENTIEVDYDDSSDTKTEQYLDDDDEFGAYHEVERYGARNNEELADLQ